MSGATYNPDAPATKLTDLSDVPAPTENSSLQYNTSTGLEWVSTINAANSSLVAELLDSGDNVVSGFSYDDCTVITDDSYSQALVWTGGAIPAGNYKVRFKLNFYNLYSFKISDGTTASATELFLDDIDLDSFSDLSISNTRPVKSESNPIFGGTDFTWDRDIYWLDVIKFSDNDYRIWYNCGTEIGTATAGGKSVTWCYATSTDGLTWTKPNLGLVSYDGNTNNNIIYDKYAIALVHNPDGATGQDYILAVSGYQTLASSTTGTVLNLLIYGSTDGQTDYTLLKDLKSESVASLPAGAIFREGHNIRILNDGRLSYTFVEIRGLDSDGGRDRSCGSIISDTTDFTGTYTFHDRAIPAAGAIDEKYSLTIVPYGDVYLGFVPRYVIAPDRYLAIELYVSRDTIKWVQVDDSWMTPGETVADWDYGLIYPGAQPLVNEGNTERFYYGGCVGLHNSGFSPANREARLGYATFGKERIGRISGAGIVTSKLRAISSGEAVYINAASMAEV